MFLLSEVKTNIPLIKGFSIVGVRAGEFGRRNPKAEQDNFKVLLNWLKEGRIKTNISHSFPLEQVAEAMQVVSNRQVQGKVVLTIREERSI